MSSTIVQRRLYTQRLIGPQFATPADAVSFFGAVQGQDLLPAMWALGLRVRDATEALIEQATFDRQLVRTWPLRKTVHFVAPADIRWMLELSAPRALKENARRRELGLDEATFAQARRIIAHALRDGQPQPRQVLRQALDDDGVSTEGQRGIHILGRLAQEGLICMGPRAGKQPTFVLIDAWLPPAKPLTRDEALAELARRYFTSHGPATIQDYIWWCGLAAAEARAGLEMVKSQLAQETLGKQVYWFDPAASSAATVPSPVAHLLPFLDEYVVAYKDRGAIAPLEYNKLVDSGNIIFHQPILIDGRMVGIWTRRLNKASVVISPQFFRPLAADEEDALRAAGERYGAFLGLTADFAPAHFVDGARSLT
jgi:hypothetical protein